MEDLAVAKPLVSVFIYGPTIPVEDTAFAHSFMDTFGGVSLDDGVTWKTTNLSQTAGLSSFTLGVDGGGGGEAMSTSCRPITTNSKETMASSRSTHAGWNTPTRTSAPSAMAPRCRVVITANRPAIAAMVPEWKEDAPDGIMVVYIEEAYAKIEKNKVKLKVIGAVEGADDRRRPLH